MRTSDQGLAFIVAHEGVVPAPYLDSVGVWTFGMDIRGAHAVCSMYVHRAS